jgi:hypothetical protein
MNLVFMNSLERNTGDDRVITAQVSIQENQGVWHVLWNEPNNSGKLQQTEWFQGSSWDEMLSVFRFKLAEKMTEGFSPLLTEVFDAEGDSGRSKLTQFLHYYSELHLSDEVFQKLRKWRNEKAAKEGNRPYQLASNRVIQMISVFLPYTEEELLQIPGLGTKKVEIYGAEMLQITKSVVRKTNFPLGWVAEQIDHQEFKQWILKQKELKFKQDMEKQANRKILLEGVCGGKNLNDLETELSVSRRDLVLWIEQLDKDGYDIDAFIDNELDGVPNKEKEMAWNAFQEVGDRYLKPILQKVYKEEEMKGKNMDAAYEWLRFLRLRFRKEKEGLQSQAS